MSIPRSSIEVDQREVRLGVLAGGSDGGGGGGGPRHGKSRVGKDLGA